jgi:hypothetical protein
MYFWGEYIVRPGNIPWEGGWDTGVGRYSYIYPKIGSLLRTPWPAKRAGKILQSMSSVNSLNWKDAFN